MHQSLGEQAYDQLRQMIVRLDLAPGTALREVDLCELLGVGRTPMREAVQRLARDHFVTVLPRRGMYVTPVEVSELPLLFETRTVLEPYAARLAAGRGAPVHWEQMARALEVAGASNVGPEDLLAVDRTCHELMWQAAGNRFLVGPLDTLYAQSARCWHLYLADIADMAEAVAEHSEILDALRAGDGDRAGRLVERHVRSFDDQIRAAITNDLAPPLAGSAGTDAHG